jgi:hypothetical protein
VRRDELRSEILGHTGPSDDKWDVDVLLETAFLAWLQPMLSDVVSVVRRVEDVSIVQDTIGLETGEDAIDQLINSLEGSQTVAEELIVVLDVLLGLLG